jgi:hypothetical protein
MSTGTVLRARGHEADRDRAARARTIDVTTGEAATAHHQRSDVCAVPAAGVVAEAMVAIVLAEAVLEKFGGDSVGETARNLELPRRDPRDAADGLGQRRRPRMTSPAIVLIGPMGAGKTSVGKRVAKRLGLPFTDSDAAIVREHGPIETIFATHGEAHFRELEREAVADALKRAASSHSAGSGARPRHPGGWPITTSHC